MNNEKAFFTDKQLCDRWHCTNMTLWRKRRHGLLPMPIKLGGRTNLTPTKVVLEFERGDPVE